MNTDDKVNSLIMLFTAFLWNITSLTLSNIINPLNIVLGAVEGTIIVTNKLNSAKPKKLEHIMDHCIASIMCTLYLWLTKHTTKFTVSVPIKLCDPSIHSPSACTILTAIANPICGPSKARQQRDGQCHCPLVVVHIDSDCCHPR